MANTIVPASELRETYRLPEEHRQAILAQVKTASSLINITQYVEIERQRQKFIEMYSDPFGTNEEE